MFYVTGLPRSGTTWFSNLLTARKSFCFHEPKINYSEKDFSMVHWLKSRDYDHIGISDSSLCLYWDEIVQPGEPMLLIKRDEKEVIHSLSKQFGFDATEIVSKMTEMLNTIKHDNVYEFNYEDINDYERVKDACKFLLEESWMDPARIKFLMQTNVQRNQDYLDTIKMMAGV